MQMFSIIMPYYKNSHIVNRSISSVINQTMQDYELIIVDDGSRDNITDIVEQYHDDRIKIIKKDNGGVSSARNLGMKNAIGKYICFLDSDDSWYCNHLSTLCEMIRRFPQKDMYITSHCKISSKTTCSNMTIQNFDNIFCVDNFLEFIYHHRGILHTNSVCVKREYLNSVEWFNEQVKISEDTDFWFRCSLNTQPVISKEITTAYYRDCNFLTKNVRHDYNWGFLKLYNSCQYDEKTNYYIRVFCEKYILSCCKHLIAEGNKTEAKQKLAMLNRNLTKENRKSFVEVLLLNILPFPIAKMVANIVYGVQKKHY